MELKTAKKLNRIFVVINATLLGVVIGVGYILYSIGAL